MKICLVGSSGGHLTHLYMLKPFWEKHERFWVTFDKEDARSILKDEKVYYCCYSRRCDEHWNGCIFILQPDIYHHPCQRDKYR